MNVLIQTADNGTLLDRNYIEIYLFWQRQSRLTLEHFSSSGAVIQVTAFTTFSTYLDSLRTIRGVLTTIPNFRSKY